MNPISIYWAEFRHEIRAGMRGPLFPIAIIGFTLYMLMVLTSGDALRNFGVVRNSAVFTYTFSTGMSMYLFFVWAWIFGQAVVRDRNVQLEENVLSSPIHLPTLLFARYLGASVVAFLIGAVIPLTLFLMPIAVWMGLVPQVDIGATPVLPILLSLLVFLLPNVLGIGALFFSSALWLRSTAGPFAVAALLMLVWMLGIIAFRGADLSDALAVLIDPTAFTEVRRQIVEWTPIEQNIRLIDISQYFLLNRLIWCLIPIGMLLILLRRMTREHLLLDNSKKKASETAITKSFSNKKVLSSVTLSGKPSWLRSLFSETLWHMRLSLLNKGLLLILVVFLIIGISGSMISIMNDGQGPKIPYPGYLLPFLLDTFYLYILFTMAGLVGLLMRRDKLIGFEEMFDATPAPLGMRVTAQVIAAFFLTMVIALSPVLSAWIVMAMSGMDIAWVDPLIYQTFMVMPLMLEICALVILSHSLIQNAGAAYSVSMMFAFIAIINLMVGLVTYPPARIGMPIPISLSSISGWEPWVSRIISSDLLKLGFITFVLSLAWFVSPRGVDFSFTARWKMALSRIKSATVLGIVGLSLITIFGGLLYQKLVVHGEYQSQDVELAEKAAWEKRWWEKGNAYSLKGGEVHISVNPSKRSFESKWTLYNVKSAKGLLHGSLPHGLSISSALVQGKEVVIDTAYDHFTLALDNCPTEGCTVEMTLTAQLQDWPEKRSHPWLHPSGVWLRASNVLPTLGLDPEHRLGIPAEREKFGLAKLTDNLPRHALKSAEAVAPKGSWSWSVEIEDKGISTETSGSLNAPLDFAMVWLPKMPKQTTQNGIKVWHGDEYGQTAKDIIDDHQLMAKCVSNLLGQVPDVNYILQAPRGLGEIAQYGDILWLPEDLGWEIVSDGPGRKRRRASIASALSRNVLLQSTDLRAQSGAQWLISGVSTWVGMECLRRNDGQKAWIAEQKWRMDDLSAAMGNLEAPVGPVADAGEAEWVKPYSALSILNWAAAQGTEQTATLIKALLKRLQNDETLPEALAVLAGQQTADRLLGMPLSSDISVHVNDKQQVTIEAKRWQWHNNGWQLISAPKKVLQLIGEKTQLIDLEKSSEIDTTGDFFILDSLPSVERTPKDNVWKKTKGKKQ